MATKYINKVVLAYSGGLDTSVILRWLQDHYNAEVVTFTADIGQGEDIEPARAKAELMGSKKSSSKTCVKNLFVTMCFQCSGPTHSMRGPIFLAPQLPGH